MQGEIGIAIPHDLSSHTLGVGFSQGERRESMDNGVTITTKCTKSTKIYAFYVLFAAIISHFVEGIRTRG
jgi:hypothetical protein